jgi:CBS domain-containing protein
MLTLDTQLRGRGALAFHTVSSGASVRQAVKQMVDRNIKSLVAVPEGAAPGAAPLLAGIVTMADV